MTTWLTDEFEVVGTPAPQGSKSRMPNGAMVEGRSSAQRALHSAWRAEVAKVARDIAGDEPPLQGPLVLSAEFRFAMPKSRSKAVRAAGRTPKVSAPDLDKILRSTGDALKEGGLIHDDALISRFADVSKVEVVGWTGAILRLGRDT